LLNIWEKQRKTVIFVTHSIEEALYLADRHRRDVAASGRIERVIEVPFARPRHDEIKSTPEFLDLRRDILAKPEKGSACLNAPNDNKREADDDNPHADNSLQPPAPAPHRCCRTERAPSKAAR